MSKERYRRLRNLRVASPCPASWADMRGDEKVRYCDICSLNVYNVSAMTSEEAEELLAQANGRLCVRFYQRSDGKILTQDCPVGLAKVRQQVAGRLSLAASFAIGLLMIPFRWQRAEELEPAPTHLVKASKPAGVKPEARPIPKDEAHFVMGDTAFTTTQRLGKVWSPVDPDKEPSFRVGERANVESASEAR